MLKVTANNLDDFLKAHAVAAIHIDAAWAVGLIEKAREAMRRAAAEFGDRVGFGEVDSDTEWRYCRALRVANVPSIAYYRNGRFFDMIVGLQDVGAAVDELLNNPEASSASIRTRARGASRKIGRERAG